MMHLAYSLPWRCLSEILIRKHYQAGNAAGSENVIKGKRKKEFDIFQKAGVCR